MANKIAGLTIEIAGDTTSLVKSLAGVNKQSKDLQSELKQVERLLKLDPTNVTLLAQKQKLLSESIDNTTDKLNTLKEAEKQVQKQFEKGEVSEEQYRALQREIISTEQKLKGFEDAASDASDGIKDLGKEADKTSDKALSFGDVLSANMISDVAIGLVKDLASAMADLTMQLDSASGKVQASLGLTAKEAAELTEVAKQVWADGFGDDITDVTNNLSIVRQSLGDMSDIELQNIIEKAYIIRDVFGEEIPGTIRAVKTLMQNFGVTADEAFDLITVGYQKGLNFSDEFIDTINEYSVQFKDMGLSVEEAFVLLKQGVDNGALSLDKIADSMKEFNIRVKDGSDTTNEGLTLLGINAEEVTQKLADGSMTTADAMQLVIDKLATTDDKVLQNKIGVNLFGTQWEDTGSQVILSLGDIESGLGDVTGATDKAGDAAYDNIGQKFSDSFRQLQEALSPATDALLDFASNLMGDVAQAIGYINTAVDFLVENFEKAREKTDELSDDVSEKFNDIKSSITTNIDEAKEAVRQAIEAIKSFFDFEWSLPDLKLPHISIKGDWDFSLSDGDGLSAPKFDVDWYKTGAIFNKPKVIGVGDGGSEAVLPIEKIDGIIASAMQKAGLSTVGNEQSGSTELTLNIPLNLDSGVLTTATSKVQFNKNSIKVRSKGALA